MTICSNRTEIGGKARLAKRLRTIPFLLCVLLFFFATPAKAQSTSSSPVGASIVWGVYDDASGEWVIWIDDSVDVNSIVWDADDSGPDPMSVVWGND